jgi:hypothetical protein
MTGRQRAGRHLDGIGLVAWNMAFAVIGTLYILKSVHVRNTFVT